MVGTRAAGWRVLAGLLVGAILINLAACVAIPPEEDHSVSDHFVSNPETPSLDVSRLPLRAALAVPGSVQAAISQHVAICTAHVNPWDFEFPVGELVSSAAEEMLSQAFVAVNRVNDKAAARGIYDVFVELSSLVVQMEDVCSSGMRYDLRIRLLLGGTITDQWGQALLAETSFETEQLLLARYDADVRPAVERALLEAVARLVRRLATKPKLIDYARTFEATHKAPTAATPIAPVPAITAPPIY